MNRSEIKAFLDEKVIQYNHPDFIATDPVSVPHRFSEPEDIEIAGFLAATIAWGQRPTIVQNANRLLDMMPGGPHHFLISAAEEDLDRFLPFVHRTFNGIDCVYFMKALKHIYTLHGGIGAVFREAYRMHGNLFDALVRFRKVFFSQDPPPRTLKHVSDVSAGAAGKRLNMYLRWMVRSDERGVDFGLWNAIPMSALHIPLDVHTASTARKLGLLKRKQNDWKAVVELTDVLRSFDATDPVRYDYALFGLGVFEKF